MSAIITNLEKITEKNKNYRRVLHTTDNLQLVVMSLEPHEYIPDEIHQFVDQFIRIEEGTATVVLNGVKTVRLEEGMSITIPKMTSHRVLNNSNTKMLKLYTIYSPPQHRDKLIQRRQPKQNN